MSVSEVSNLLIKARAKNEMLAVTGALLFDGRGFLQVLEGAEESVQKVLDRIADDPRHSHVTVVLDEKVRKRSFGDWSMGLAEVSSQDLRDLPGLTDLKTARAALSKVGIANALMQKITSNEFRQRLV